MRGRHHVRRLDAAACVRARRDADVRSRVQLRRHAERVLPRHRAVVRSDLGHVHERGPRRRAHLRRRHPVSLLHRSSAVPGAAEAMHELDLRVHTELAEHRLRMATHGVDTDE